jgi:hypothetical protein
MKSNSSSNGGNGDSDAPLPKPNAKLRLRDSHTAFTEQEVRGMIANPVYAGIGPLPQLVRDEQWVRAAVRAIEKDGPEQFLVNLLHVPAGIL